MSAPMPERVWMQRRETGELVWHHRDPTPTWGGEWITYVPESRLLAAEARAILAREET